MPAAKLFDFGYFAVPADGVPRQAVKQDGSQLGSIDLRPVAIRGAGVLKMQRALRVEIAIALVLVAGELFKLRLQAGLPQGKKPRLDVQIERAALRPGQRMCVELKDRRRDAPRGQDPRQGQSARSAPHDTDAFLVLHRDLCNA